MTTGEGQRPVDQSFVRVITQLILASPFTDILPMQLCVLAQDATTEDALALLRSQKSPDAVFGVSGGQHYLQGQAAAFAIRPALRTHPKHSHLLARVYAFGSLHQVSALFEQYEGGNLSRHDYQAALTKVPGWASLNDDERAACPAIAVARAHLVREHNEVPQLASAITDRQVYTYIREAMKELHYKTLKDIPDDRLKQFMIMANVKDKVNFYPKLRVAQCNDEIWALLMEVQIILRIICLFTNYSQNNLFKFVAVY